MRVAKYISVFLNSADRTPRGTAMGDGGVGRGRGGGGGGAGDRGTEANRRTIISYELQKES